MHWCRKHNTTNYGVCPECRTEAEIESLKSLKDCHGGIGTDKPTCGKCLVCVTGDLAAARTAGAKLIQAAEIRSKEMDALRARAEKAEADFLACAQAADIVYEAEGHASAPGPVERVVEAIREGQRAEGERDDLRAALETAEADARQYLQAAHASGADLAEIGRLCGIRDDEYPLKAAQRVVAEAAAMRGALVEALDHTGFCGGGEKGDCGCITCRIRAALSSDAGRDLLRVVEAAKALRDVPQHMMTAEIRTVLEALAEIGEAHHGK